jgi:hypothetical protein
MRFPRLLAVTSLALLFAAPTPSAEALAEKGDAKPKRTFQFRTAPFRPRKKLPFHPIQIATLEIEWVRSLIILQMDFRQLNHLDRAAYP